MRGRFLLRKNECCFLDRWLGVACRVKVDENGVVGRNEIVKRVRSLINGEDGHNMRKKMSELKDLQWLRWFIN